MKRRFALLIVAIIAVVISGCSTLPDVQPATETTTISPTVTVTNTLTPTVTPTIAATPTPTATAMITADEIEACPQILYDALEESAEPHYMDFPGLKFNNNHGGIGVMYYTISLADTKVVTIEGVQADVIKMLAVDINPTDGKPVIRTYWQMLGYDNNDGTPYNKLVSWGNPQQDAIDTYDTIFVNGIVDSDTWNINRDVLLQAYDSNYFFINSIASDEAGSNAVFAMNPFRVIPENGKYYKFLGGDVLRFGLAYEEKNGLIINNSFFAYKPYPEDWVNTIMEFYRVESIDDLKTTPIDKVRTCLDTLK